MKTANSILRIIVFVIFFTSIAGLVTQAQTPDAAQVLGTEQTLEREMAGAETHRYKIELKANEFFQVRVEQKGIDVALRLLDEGGTILATMDSPNGSDGPETLSFIANETRVFILEISGFDKNAARGNYLIKREKSNPATADNRLRVKTEKLFIEGMSALSDGTQAQMALPKLEESLSGWQSLQETYLAEITGKQIKYIKTNALFAEATNLVAKGDWYSVKDALQKFETVLKSSQELGDKRLESYSAGWVGHTYGLLGEPQTALKFLNQSLLISQSIDDQVQVAAMFNSIGGMHNALSEKEKALEYLNKALQLYRKLADKNGEGNTFFTIGAVFLKAGDSQKAIENYKTAFEIYKVAGNKGNQAEAALKLGEIYKNLEQYKNAFEFLNQALPLMRQTENKRGEVNVLINIAMSHWGTTDRQKTLEFLDQAISVLNPIADTRDIEILGAMGASYKILGEYSKSLNIFKQIHSIVIPVGNIVLEIDTLNWIGNNYIKMGNFKEALSSFNQGLMILKANQNIELNEEVKNALADKESAIYEGLAIIYSIFGDKQNSLKYMNMGLSIRQKRGQKFEEAVALKALGLIYAELGEIKKAFEYLNQSLNILKTLEAGNTNLITAELGFVYSLLSEKEDAIRCFERVLPLLRQTGAKDTEAEVLAQMGFIFLESVESQKELEPGLSQKAMEYLKQALPLYKASGNKKDESRVAYGIGLALNNIMENTKNIMLVFEASQYFRQAAQLAQETGNKDLEIESRLFLNKYYLNPDRKSADIDNVNETLLQSLISSTTGLKIQGLIVNFMVWNHFRNSKLAVFFGKQFVNKTQQIRQSAQGLDSKAQKTLQKNYKITYQRLNDLLLKEGRVAEAVQILNLYRDEQFFDFSEKSVTSAKNALYTPREKELALNFDQAIEKVKNIARQIQTLKQKIMESHSDQDSANLRKLENDLKNASGEFLALLNRAESEFSGALDEKDKIGEITDLTEIQTNLREFNEKTGQKAIAIYQMVGDDNFSSVLITPVGTEQISIPIKGVELSEKAKKLWVLLQSEKYDPTKLSKEIYDVIFVPLKAKIPDGTTTIMWSLDGNLRYIPMAALYDGEKYLVEKYKNIVFTRADKDQLIKPVSSNWTATVFGNSLTQTIDLLDNGNKVTYSALPGVTEEIRAIFREGDKDEGILNAEVFSDKQFTKNAFYEALKKQRPLVHISSHFVFRPGDDSRSFLILGDGFLTLSEMKKQTNLFQKVELLTLSACNTAATQSDANGREIDGFAELAQRLGAGAIMATLWQVSDASTPWLMRDFYVTRESKAGVTKAEALRAGQLGLLTGTAQIESLSNVKKSDSTFNVRVVVTPDGKPDKDTRGTETVYVAEKEAPLFIKDAKKPYAHPYYWAPFILIGNWR